MVVNIRLDFDYAFYYYLLAEQNQPSQHIWIELKKPSKYARGSAGSQWNMLGQTLSSVKQLLMECLQCQFVVAFPLLGRFFSIGTRLYPDQEHR